jgi:DNA-binding SARP family transcriptional activator
VRLVEWIEALPAELLEADQWLLYFVGSARLWTDPHEARAWLERAYALAATRRDESCVVRAVAGIVDAAFLEYSEFKSVDRWIEVLNNAVRSDAVCANPDVELRANVALLSATFYRRGNVPELQALAEHTLSLVERHDDVNLRTAAVAWLLSYVANTGRFELAARILPLAAALIEHSEVTPLRRGLCAYFTAWTYVSMCDAQGANTYMEKLMRLAEEFGLQRLRRFAAVIGFWIWMIDRQGDGQQWVEVFEHALGDAHPYDLASHNAMRALLAQSQNDVVSGMQYARLALPAYEQVGSPWHRLMIRAILLWAAVELGDELQARKVLSELRDLVRESRLDAYLLLLHQAEAWLMLRASEGERLVEKLRILFDNAGQFGLGMPMRFILPWMPRLCAEALHCGVSAPYVTGLIRAHGWSAPLLHLRQWPWPVRIHTLGRFSIEVDGEPISFSTKAPRKALALLKALICSSGVEVRDHQLIDALWKDDEADAARAAFNVTLHRLRRLLGHLDAIEVSDGCLTLNPKIVWVDAFAYEYLLANSADPSVEDIDEALQLYRGPLLPTDGAESWSAAARERMRAKFLHHVGRRAQQLESERRWDEAVALYLRGLDADNLSESFYQGLMRCHKECGRHAEALSLYWRLRQTLSVSLGISPSAHTEVLFQEIGQKARSARR